MGKLSKWNKIQHEDFKLDCKINWVWRVWIKKKEIDIKREDASPFLTFPEVVMKHLCHAVDKIPQRPCLDLVTSVLSDPIKVESSGRICSHLALTCACICISSDSLRWDLTLPPYMQISHGVTYEGQQHTKLRLIAQTKKRKPGLMIWNHAVLIYAERRLSVCCWN